MRDPERRRAIDRDRQVFVAEGLLVLEALVASPYRVRSALVSPARVDAVARRLAGVDAPIYVAAPEVLAEVAGYSLHRGIVALGERRSWPAVADLIEEDRPEQDRPEQVRPERDGPEGDRPAGDRLTRSRLVVAVEGVNDHENLGALYRNAAAFAADAVLLDPTTADPLYRRCLRVSMGHALRVPTARMEPWPQALADLVGRGWTVLALTPDCQAEDLEAAVSSLDRDGVQPASVQPRVILLVGAEGPGLSPAALAAASHRVRIPMAAEVDSLNVATAAAIALHLLHSRLGRGA